MHTAAQYYYYPGWQEPGPTLECIVNKAAWESLPADLQAIVDVACQAINADVNAEYTNGNVNALGELDADPDVEIRAFPEEVLDYLESIADEVVEELVAADPASAKVYASYADFRDKSRLNQKITEQAYLETRD